MMYAKKGSFRKSLLATTVLAPAMIVAGCGSSYDSRNDSGSSKSGVAYDGYLKNAKACVDVNLNKVCDAGEPSTTTIQGGIYLFDGLTEAQALFPLALEATAGTTVDEDTDEAVDEDFVYVAPASASTLSAFTTLIQIDTERRIAAGASPAEAEVAAKAELAALVGAPVGTDLTDYDAVAKSKANDSDANQATQLRVLNQVLTKQMIAAINDAPAGDKSAVLNAVGKKVKDKVTVTKGVVDQKLSESGVTGPDITGETIAQIATQTIAEAVTQVEAVTSADIAEAVAEIKKAQAQIIAVIKETVDEQVPDPEEPEEPTTGGTGGTGGSSGGQGTS